MGIVILTRIYNPYCRWKLPLAGYRLTAQSVGCLFANVAGKFTVSAKDSAHSQEKGMHSQQHKRYEKMCMDITWIVMLCNKSELQCGLMLLAWEHRENSYCSTTNCLFLKYIPKCHNFLPNYIYVPLGGAINIKCVKVVSNPYWMQIWRKITSLGCSKCNAKYKVLFIEW